MTKEATTMLMIDFWIVRNGEDTRKAIISWPPSNTGYCLLCGEDHDRAAVIVFRWDRDINAFATAGFCARCARHRDQQLAEMTQQVVFPDRVSEEGRLA
jgi:hypothetical protein